MSKKGGNNAQPKLFPNNKNLAAPATPRPTQKNQRIPVFVARFKCHVNSTVYGDSEMAQVQLRLPEKTVEQIDTWVAEGKFKNRSDAIKTIITLYEEREKTRKFYAMLQKRSKEAKEHPERLVRLEDV
jgi:Arc/MetJ-type ribon-helix-helix transcriptional regulator